MERVGLILGFKDTLKDDYKIKNFVEELKKMKDNLAKILGKHFSPGIYTFNYIDWINKAETDFSHQDYKET